MQEERMRQDIRENFAEKASFIARNISGMTVIDQSDFLAVDSALPSDTFNVLVVRNMSRPASLLATVDRFQSKGFPLAVWYWQDSVADTDRSLFSQHGLSYAETNTTMYADLTEIEVVPPYIEGLKITRVTTTTDLLQIGQLLAAGFGASDEGHQVFAYFQRLSTYPLHLFPAMHHFIARLHGTVVATGTLFVGSETVGIYDLVTHDDYRRRGIGSAMFQHLLADASTCNRRYCVLQASTDGLGIYLKAGFKTAGNVHTFENRTLIIN